MYKIGRIAMLTDHEEYQEAEQLEKWFQKFLEVHRLTLGINRKRIEHIWLSLSIADRLKVINEVTYRIRMCRKQGITYGEALRGIFTEAEHDAAVRLRPGARTLVEGEPE
jgi:hypothetical protein